MPRPPTVVQWTNGTEVTMRAGQLVIAFNEDGEAHLAQAGDSVVLTGPVGVISGVPAAGIGEDEVFQAVIDGEVVVAMEGGLPTLAVGQPLYVSENSAGTATTVAPSVGPFQIGVIKSLQATDDTVLAAIGSNLSSLTDLNGLLASPRFLNVDGATSEVLHVARRTQVNIPAFTPAGAGPGATITFNAPGLINIDGPVNFVGQRFLINMVAGNINAGSIHMGIYSVTVMGDGSTQGVMTRTTDFDEAIPTKYFWGRLIHIDEGTDAGLTYVSLHQSGIGVDIDVNMRMTYQRPDLMFATKGLSAQIVGRAEFFGTTPDQQVIIGSGTITTTGDVGVGGELDVKGGNVTVDIGSISVSAGNISANSGTVGGAELAAVATLNFFGLGSNGLQPPIPDPTGGSTIDTECRDSVDSILATLRLFLIGT